MDIEIVFLALAIANKAAMDIAVQIIPPDSDFISLHVYNQSGIAGSHGKFFSRNLHAVSHVTFPAYFPTNCAQKLFLHVLTNTELLPFLSRFL